MRLWIDCEWNGWQGDLISMALVAEDGRSFYEIMAPAVRNVDPWVKEHVLPVLGDREPVAQPWFNNRLWHYLTQFEEVEIVADWPEDIMWFCGVFVHRGGVCDMPFRTVRFTLDRDIEGASRIPHNALEDARANMAWSLAHTP